MKLNVISLKGVEFTGDVAGFNVKTTSGEITILEHHRPLITILKNGTAYIMQHDGSGLPVEINSGFLEMSPDNELNVLVN
ncbi:MAG: hypothetical protein HYZ69_00845 [Candidatus Colwellbacteria bacterium]|nr:hypothetical protein [Candidatus Colwellbacteria bacterium]